MATRNDHQNDASVYYDYKFGPPGSVALYVEPAHIIGSGYFQHVDHAIRLSFSDLNRCHYCGNPVHGEKCVSCGALDWHERNHPLHA